MSELVKHHCQSGEAIRDKMVIYPLETPVAEYIVDLQKQNAALQAKVDLLESNSDVRCVSELILRGDNGEMGEISSCLFQDFKTKTCRFNVKHTDDTEFTVSIIFEDITNDQRD